MSAHELFGEKAASSYNDRWAKIAPFRDGLHLAIRSRFSDLPANARILCVGAGTGVEILYGLQEGYEENSKDLLLHGAFRGASVEDIYAELASGKIDGLALFA